MFRKLSATLFLILFVTVCSAQKRDTPAIDTTIYDYDELFSELDALLDSLYAPRSIVLANLNIGQRVLNYETTSAAATETRKRIRYSPSIGYFHRSGFGFGAGAALINDDKKFNIYQYSLTGSFDYQKNKAFITGISFTHFFTKKDLSFYTSPLQDEVYGYFTYRKFNLKPTVGVSYGWGNRENYQEVAEKIKKKKLMQQGVTRINTNEKIMDLNLFTSLRHDFYLLKVLSSDYIRLTPQISFVSGSQQFGFNQTTSTYGTVRRTGNNILIDSEQQSFDDQFNFQPISLTTFLKAEYAKGKFYVQPQLMFDYYFPASSNHFSTAFFMNVGFVF